MNADEPAVKFKVRQQSCSEAADHPLQANRVNGSKTVEAGHNRAMQRFQLSRGADVAKCDLYRLRHDPQSSEYDARSLKRKRIFKTFRVTRIQRWHSSRRGNIVLRIGIIAHLKHPIREPFAGGLETHTYLLARKLLERGHDVVVFAAEGSSERIAVDVISSQTAFDLLGTDEAEDVAFFKEHHAYLTLMNNLRSSHFDIIHNNSLHYLPIIMADALPMPMVTTLHTPPFKWLASGVHIADNRHLRLVAVSDSIRNEWEDVAVAQEVITNGVDLTRFRFNAKPAADPYLVWYGRIVPEKGLHYAIDAARLTGMTLRFAGPLLDTKYFESEIRPRLDDDTLYDGHLNHAELSALVGGARAFLCTPCWEEPYGLVVAEALACGTPVAAFARGAIPMILTSLSGALAKPDDAQSLADAAKIALTLNRVDCRHRAEKFCDVERMIDGYEATYRRMRTPHASSENVTLANANMSLSEVV